MKIGAQFARERTLVAAEAHLGNARDDHGLVEGLVVKQVAERAENDARNFLADCLLQDVDEATHNVVLEYLAQQFLMERYEPDAKAELRMRAVSGVRQATGGGAEVTHRTK